MTKYKYETRNKYTSLPLLRVLHVSYNMNGWRGAAFGLMSPWLSIQHDDNGSVKNIFKIQTSITFIIDRHEGSCLKTEWCFLQGI